jgi:hypothetical protein
MTVYLALLENASYWVCLVAEEAQELLQDLLRLLFRKVMSAVQSPSFHWRIRVLPPDFEHVSELLRAPGVPF